MFELRQQMRALRIQEKVLNLHDAKQLASNSNNQKKINPKQTSHSVAESDEIKAIQMITNNKLEALEIAPSKVHVADDEFFNLSPFGERLSNYAFIESDSSDEDIKLETEYKRDTYVFYCYLFIVFI